MTSSSEPSSSKAPGPRGDSVFGQPVRSPAHPSSSSSAHPLNTRLPPAFVSDRGGDRVSRGDNTIPKAASRPPSTTIGCTIRAATTKGLQTGLGRGARDSEVGVLAPQRPSAARLQQEGSLVRATMCSYTAQLERWRCADPSASSGIPGGRSTSTDENATHPPHRPRHALHQHHSRREADAVAPHERSANRHVNEYSDALSYSALGATPKNLRFGLARRTIAALVLRNHRANAARSSANRTICCLEAMSSKERIYARAMPRTATLRDEVMTLVAAGHERPRTPSPGTFYFCRSTRRYASRFDAKWISVSGGAPPSIYALPRSF